MTADLSKPSIQPSVRLSSRLHELLILQRRIRLQIYQENKSPCFDSNNYETKQVFYPSAGGVKVPMFITHRKVNTSFKQVSSFFPMSATFSAIRVSSARRIPLVFYMDTADTASLKVQFLTFVLSRSSRPLMGFSLMQTFVVDRKTSLVRKYVV